MLLLGFITAVQVHLTSLLVKGTPSLHFTSLRKWYVIVRPSRLMPPLVVLGTSVVRSACCTPLSSGWMSGKNMKRAMKTSVVFEVSSGLRFLGSSWMATRRTPGSVHECSPPVSSETFEQPPRSPARAARANRRFTRRKASYDLAKRRGSAPKGPNATG